MTQEAKINSSSTNWIYLYSLVAPATGANAVTATFTGGGTVDWMAVAYSGVSQTDLLEAVRTGTSTGSNLSQTITTVTDKSWAVIANMNSESNTLTPGTNYTQRGSPVSGKELQIADSAAVVSPAGNITQSATSPDSTTYGFIQAAIKPSDTYIWKTSAAATTTSASFIGFANAAISEGALGDVVIGGEVTGLSGLIGGGQYYLANTAGTISTASGTISRKAGIGTSPSTLIITNTW